MTEPTKEAVKLAEDVDSPLWNAPLIIQSALDKARADERARVGYSEKDLRDAFKAGWKERNRYPGLRKQARKSLDNALRSVMGGGRYNDFDLVPDSKTYAHAIWLRSAFRKSLERGDHHTSAGD